MAPEHAGSRKDDHVRLAAEQQSATGEQDGTSPASPFDDVRFVHHALAGVDAAEVDLAVDVAGATWSVPFFINAMTGGSDVTGRINRDLAAAAAATGVPLASGSMSIALDNPEVAHTFRVIRDENPHGFVFANVGVERSADDARRAVDLLQADALQVHVNAVQETVMPEGSRSFSSWPTSLERIVDAVDVPVIVKEVGFGLSSRTLSQLAELGVQWADVSGRGGTDFVRIENARRRLGDFDYLAGWGQSAVDCLIDAPSDGPSLLASGGVRTPLDVARALALGANAVGVSGSFLAVVLDGGAEAMTAHLERWRAHVTALLALAGARIPAAMTATDLLITGATAETARSRGIDVAHFAHRTLATATVPGKDSHAR